MGLLLPSTHVPYSYQVDPDRPRDPAGLRLEEERAAVVAELFTMYSEGEASLFGLSRRLYQRGIRAPHGGKGWSVATLRGILTIPVCAGQIYAWRVRYRPLKIRRSATHPIGRRHTRLSHSPARRMDSGSHRAGSGYSGTVRSS